MFNLINHHKKHKCLAETKMDSECQKKKKNPKGGFHWICNMDGLSWLRPNITMRLAPIPSLCLAMKQRLEEIERENLQCTADQLKKEGEESMGQVSSCPDCQFR